jgi:hypothetical protein
MALEDEVEFLDFARSKFGLSADDQWLVSPTCPREGIQFLRSQRFGEELTAGRISLATHYGGVTRFTDEAPVLEKTYLALRRYIQKNFSNKLAAFKDGERSKFTYRNLWLGPHAHTWLIAQPEGLLKQGRGSRSNFVPECTDQVRHHG